MVTEDIDISWKLQTDFWDIRYEPRALCWILMPETIRGLWRQRLRWSQGGSEILKKYFKTMFNWKQRRIWPIYLEYFLSVFWSYCFAMTFLLFFLGFLIDLPEYLTVTSIFPGYTGVILSIVCLIQLTVGLILDSRYERGVMKLFFWLIWYPAIYWVLNATVCLFAFPMAMFKPKHRKAVWESPDRGL